MKTFLRTFGSVAICVVSLFPANIVAMLFAYMLLFLTKQTYISYLIPCVAIGPIVAFPTVFGIIKLPIRFKFLKCILIIFSVVLYSLILFLSMQR